MTVLPVVAGTVSQQPDPEVLRQFEAEQKAAQEQQQEGRKKVQQGQEEIDAADRKQRQLEADSNAELCSLGALPPSMCP